MGFSHVCVGSNDLERSRTFYDAALAPLGIKRTTDMENRFLYEGDGLRLIVTKPIDGEAATFANGGTIGFPAADNAAVDAFHGSGLSNGGSCAGAPGPRPQVPGAYGAYLRDPDGNKICAFAWNA